MFTDQPRPLPYPLDNVLAIEAEIPDQEADCIVPVFPEDSDEKITVLFRFSLNEFIAIASAIDVGRDIAFGKDAPKLWWLWTVNLMCASFCEQVIDCIDNDADVRAALAQWFAFAAQNDTIVQQALQNAFNPAQGGSAIPAGYANQNQYGAALGCDNDDGWGHIRNGLIDRSFQRVQDVLDRIEFVTDNKDMLAEFVNAIPGVGAFFDVIPVTDWVLWFDNVRSWMKAGFEAGDSTELRDEIACDLFCIWQEDCSLSVEQIRRYYWDKVELLLPSWSGAFTGMAELAAVLAASTVSFGDAIVYALVGTQYGFQTYVNDWFGIHINVVGNDLALGDPSADWETLCDDCPECGIGYTVTTGSEAVPPDIVSAATALINRLDTAGTAYGRRIELEFAVAVTKLSLGWNTEGAGDDMFAQLAGNATQTLPTPSGSTTLIFATPATTFIVDLGYAGDSGAYASNPARISVTDACE